MESILIDGKIPFSIFEKSHEEIDILFRDIDYTEYKFFPTVNSWNFRTVIHIFEKYPSLRQKFIQKLENVGEYNPTIFSLLYENNILNAESFLTYKIIYAATSGGFIDVLRILYNYDNTVRCFKKR